MGKQFETIPENAVGTLGAMEVAAANGCREDYVTHYGLKSHGPTMLLLVFDSGHEERVGIGSSITIDGILWHINDIQLDGGNGEITLCSDELNNTTRAASEGQPDLESLDFLFSEDCTCCGCPAGWDGSVHISVEFGPGVGMMCTQCSQSGWTYGGQLPLIFQKGVPLFMPGRGEQPGAKRTIQGTESWPPTIKSDIELSKQRIFNGAILIGGLIALYIFGYRFEQLSETELVHLSPLWLSPIIFGLYGRAAVRLMQKIRMGITQQKPSKTSFTYNISETGNLHFQHIYSGTPLKSAVRGVVIWLLLLIVFLFAIWPNL